MKIFHIYFSFFFPTQRVDKENTLDENTLTQGDGSYYDYCSEISDETRAEMIDYLVNELLPKGMFSLVDTDKMVYYGGADEWKAKKLKS